ncbi:MAG TPA: DUF4396 domain-containing protein [Sphingomonas sp.]|nr:DUF4396 domain-containing protein [Sphingomonas sp.]
MPISASPIRTRTKQPAERDRRNERCRQALSVVIMTNFPPLLHGVAIVSLALAFACAAVISLDEMRRPQRMWIMNLVWPLCALFGSALWLWAYYRWGRTRHGSGTKTEQPPFAVSVAIGASHCGAGCALGDIVAEWAALAFPSIAIWFGLGSLFAEKTFAIWIPDFLLAFVFGIVFQYYAIKPMRDLSVGQGILAALKADAASISAWQVGMYGVMALIQFLWFRPHYGGSAEVDTPEFWFAMQLAMLAGFCTSYPANWMLIKAGLKERMG